MTSACEISGAVLAEQRLVVSGDAVADRHPQPGEQPDERWEQPPADRLGVFVGLEVVDVGSAQGVDRLTHEVDQAFQVKPIDCLGIRTTSPFDSSRGGVGWTSAGSTSVRSTATSRATGYRLASRSAANSTRRDRDPGLPGRPRSLLPRAACGRARTLSRPFPGPVPAISNVVSCCEASSSSLVARSAAFRRDSSNSLLSHRCRRLCRGRRRGARRRAGSRRPS